ncbi:uncharacterized protein LOC110388181 isoform X2 [Numida meleagris]|nr:uncharacterized protein LOC110388181 isoform X2 [Numida meleagris]
MNGTANLAPTTRGHFTSAIPVPRSTTPNKPPAATPPARHSTPGPPPSHRASSPRPAAPPSLKSLKPRPRASGREATESPGVPPHGGQRAPVPPGKGLGGGRVECSLRGPGAHRPLGMAMEDGTNSVPTSRSPVFGSGAISFSSASSQSRPVTATVAPFQYRLQEDGEQMAPSLCDTAPAEVPDPKPGAMSKSVGFCCVCTGCAGGFRAPLAWGCPRPVHVGCVGALPQSSSCPIPGLCLGSPCKNRAQCCGGRCLCGRLALLAAGSVLLGAVGHACTLGPTAAEW